jgi:hypothetical protein
MGQHLQQAAPWRTVYSAAMPNTQATPNEPKQPDSLLALDYHDEADALLHDPVIVAMAAEVPDGTDVDAWSFTTAALREYQKRGGTASTHIGGPAAAIKALLNAGDLPLHQPGEPWHEAEAPLRTGYPTDYERNG